MATLDKIVKSIRKYKPLLIAGVSTLALNRSVNELFSGDYLDGVSGAILGIFCGYYSCKEYNKRIAKE